MRYSVLSGAFMGTMSGIQRKKKKKVWKAKKRAVMKELKIYVDDTSSDEDDSESELPEKRQRTD